MTNRVEAIAENVWTRLLARGAMILIAAVVTIAGLYWNAVLDGINNNVGATLHEVKMLADSERKNSDAIIKLQGDIRVGEQKDGEQDRVLDRHERLLSNRSRYSYPPRPE